MWTEFMKMVIKLNISGRLFISETSNWLMKYPFINYITELYRFLITYYYYYQNSQFIVIYHDLSEHLGSEAEFEN